MPLSTPGGRRRPDPSSLVSNITDISSESTLTGLSTAPFPGAIETKPGSATVPFFGHAPVILDAVSGKELEGNNVEVLEQLANQCSMLMDPGCTCAEHTVAFHCSHNLERSQALYGNVYATLPWSVLYRRRSRARRTRLHLDQRPS